MAQCPAKVKKIAHQSHQRGWSVLGPSLGTVQGHSIYFHAMGRSLRISELVVLFQVSLSSRSTPSSYLPQKQALKNNNNNNNFNSGDVCVGGQQVCVCKASRVARVGFVYLHK